MSCDKGDNPAFPFVYKKKDNMRDNMESEIKINLLKNKAKYTANLGENDYRVYTPGETITEQKDFMRFVKILNDFIFQLTNKILEAMERMWKTVTSNRRLSES